MRLVVAALNIVSDPLSIPTLEATGAVIGTGISNLMIHVTEFVLLRRMVVRITQ